MIGEQSQRRPRKLNSTLLWEALRVPPVEVGNAEAPASKADRVLQRLPYDDRCVARTKDGRRCRCKPRGQSDYCAFHDPSITAEERRAKARKAARTRRARPALPRGYPRRLASPEAARRALECLYVETRAGLVTPQQAKTLLLIINRLIDGSADRGKPSVPVAAERAAFKPFDPVSGHRFGVHN